MNRWRSLVSLVTDHFALIAAVAVLGSVGGGLLAAANPTLKAFAPFSYFLAGLLSLLVSLLVVWVAWALCRWVLSGHVRGLVTDASVDRAALAARAEELARSISAFAGEYAGEFQTAWERDSAEHMSVRNHSRAVEAKFLQRYALKYHQEVLDIFLTAKKCIVVNESDMWHLGHSLTSSHEFAAVVQYLTKLAVDLRHPHPNLPTPRELSQLRDQVQRLTSQLQALRAKTQKS